MTPEQRTPPNDATDARATPAPDDMPNGEGIGATEDEVIRDATVVTPDVTDMGRDELGRDWPDEPGWGRGATPAGATADDRAETEREGAS
ncbi:MAG: hypothetical protein IVW57_14975 [Ktedonobacterales bacterium]|nr:hypothetical protein [Ktedonobacterales bacterium]